MSKEPIIRVGVVAGASEIRGEFSGAFRDAAGREAPPGEFTATFGDGAIRLNGGPPLASLHFTPVDFDSARVTLHDVTIGIDFHWQRRESQQFQGALTLNALPGGITAINELPIEAYLVSVISSEMSAANPPDLLRAHAIISRSWLLAQLAAEKSAGAAPAAASESPDEIIRWYDRENHADFDVCADDHCQRYQGISKAFSPEAFAAVRDTRGVALVFGEEICDARYSKSCGGMTEVFSAAWGDRDVPYLQAVYDGPGALDPEALPLADEAKARRWILQSPPAYCNTTNRELLGRMLPNFDQETSDFYRWRVVYSQDELRDMLRSRLSEDPGRIRALVPLARGQSGRITRLCVEGERRQAVIGKELVIRRMLSRSHLYSSAFVVETAGAGEFPESFTLIGAGWGHGVGLCQIGAAVMAAQGHSHEAILSHYFRGAALRPIY